MENTSTKQQDTTYTFERFRSDIFQYETVYKDDVTDQQYFGFPIEPILAVENSLLSNTAKSIAYLSMEYGIAPSIYNSFKLTKPMDNKNNFFTHEVFSNQWLCDYLFKIKTDKMLDIPIYGGGLGVLAGDSMKSAADLGFSIAGIGILWNKGYFKQKFWYKHGQIPEELMWNPNSYPGLVPLNNVVEITTKEGNIKLRLWKYYVYSYDKKSACPIILLDSNLPENPEHFQKLTDQLYRSDDVWWKILQRAILGIGGIRALESLGYNIDIYHLNEGHAAFAFLEKYLQLTDKVHLDNLKKSFAYTCHTPVEAGHDRFHMNDVSRILTEPYSEAATLFGKEKEKDDLINLTYICLNNCLNINAVAQKHGEITRLQFPKFASKVKAITNGVHAHTWISQSFKDLFNKYQSVLGNWENTPENLEKVTQLKNDEAFRKDIFEAHQINKRQLMNILRHWQVDENVLTIGWARRIAGYKRPALIFHDVQKIIQIARDIGPIQIILAGKAHPNDNIGSAHIDEILDHIDQLNAYNEIVKVLILENYDTYFGKLLTNCVDVWLNNPLPPFEASGTSGMKAILNGVLQLSTLDGWVVEAADKNIGWIFGFQHEGSDIGTEQDLRLDEDSKALYDNLREVAGLYYQTNNKGAINLKSSWIDKMINCVQQGGFFNTQRMLKEYNNSMWHIFK